jgi:hypothetical protein
MNPKTSKTNRLASLAVGVVVALLIAGVLLGFHRMLGFSDRGAFGALTITGMVFCLTGMKIEVYGWKNPFNLFGSGLGAVILLLIAAVFTGIPFPWVSSDREAFIALAVLIALKVVLDLLRGIAAKFLPSTERVALD